MADQDMINAITPRLLGVLAQAAALGAVAHAGLKGRLREILIRDAIAPFLPPSVEPLSGTIVSTVAKRQARTQDDLVLFARDLAPVLWEADQAIMPIEGALAHFEIKSRLDRDQLVHAFKAAAELRDLASREAPAPAGLVFAYDCNFTTSTDGRWIVDALGTSGVACAPRQAVSALQMITIGTRGTWILSAFEGRSGWWFAPAETGRHMLTFVSTISNYSYKARTGARGVGTYLLDPAWLRGPDPECPCVVPEPPKTVAERDESR